MCSSHYFQEAEQESQQSQSGKYRKITTVESKTRGFQWLLIFKRHFKVWRPSNLWVCVFLENKYTIYIYTCTGAVGAHCFFSHYIHIVIVASSLECCLVLYCSYSYTHDKTNFENKECVQHFSFFDIFLLWNNTKYLHGNGEILILNSEEMKESLYMIDEWCDNRLCIGYSWKIFGLIFKRKCHFTQLSFDWTFVHVVRNRQGWSV